MLKSDLKAEAALWWKVGYTFNMTLAKLQSKNVTSVQLRQVWMELKHERDEKRG